MNKKFWLVLGIVAAALVGYLLLQGDRKPAGEIKDLSAAPSIHVKGNKEAKVVLTEFVDFQCPFCAQFYPKVEQLMEELKNDVRLEFRNLPLPAAHKNAYAAARAAEAAHEQAKYWEMVELLFANQQTWGQTSDPRPVFEQYAQVLELNLGKFNTDFESSAINSRINDDIALYNATGRKLSTPSFFLNGKALELESDNYEELKSQVEAAIAEAKTSKTE